MQEYRGEWGWVGFEREGAAWAVREAAARAAERIRRSATPSARAHRLDWTIAETAAHLVVVARANAGYAQGRAEPVLLLERLAETNQTRIEELPEREPLVLADQLESAIDGLLAELDGRGATETVPWHSHTTLPIGGMLGIVLAELLLHDRDVALGQGERWQVTPADARHVVRGGMAFGPLVVNRDAARQRPASFRVRCDGVPTTTWRFGASGLSISPGDTDPVDCQLRLDPAALMLIGFGRVSPFVAALRGRALSWGRRPLAAFHIPNYFVVS